MTLRKYLLILAIILLVPVLSGDIEAQVQPQAKLLDWEGVVCEQVADQSSRSASRFAEVSVNLPIRMIPGRTYHLSFATQFNLKPDTDGASLKMLLVSNFNQQQELGALEYFERYSQTELIITAQFAASNLVIKPANDDFIPEYLLSDISQSLMTDSVTASSRVSEYPVQPVSTGTDGQFSVPLNQGEMVTQDFTVSEDQILTDIDLPLVRVGNGGLGAYRVRLIDNETNSLVGSTTLLTESLGRLKIDTDLYRLPFYAFLQADKPYRLGIDASGVRTDRRNRLILSADTATDGQGAIQSDDALVVLGQNIVATLNFLESSKLASEISQTPSQVVEVADSVPLGPVSVLARFSGTKQVAGSTAFGTDREIVFLPAKDGSSMLMSIPVTSSTHARQLSVALDSPCTDTVPPVVEYSADGTSWTPVPSTYFQGNTGLVNRFAAIINLPSNIREVKLRIGYDEQSKEFSGQEFVAIRGVKAVVR